MKAGFPTRAGRISFGGLEVLVSLDERYAGALRRSGALRRALRSALSLLQRRSIHNGMGAKLKSPANAIVFDPAAFAPPDAQAIARRVLELEWYHALELPHGIVTPGRADHRRQKHRYGLPEDMTGMRALDVATFDGFWAFEMERRGADVTAVDIGRWSQADIPLRWLERMRPEEDRTTGDGFRLAKELLGSNVERVEMSIYDLDPGKLGTFDLVFLSDLLLHLRDPQRALEKLWTVVRKSGYAIIAEPYSPEIDGFKGVALTQFIGYQKFVWQVPSSAALRGMLDLAGFGEVEELARFRLDYDHPFPVQKVVYRARPRNYGTGG